MSTLTRYGSSCKLTPTLTLVGDAVSGQTLSPTHFNPTDLALTSATTPPVSLYYADELTGDSGTPTWTIDLTSWSDVEGVTKSATGLKLQEMRIQADAANTSVVNIAPGDANAYSPFGTGNDVDVQVGGLILVRGNDKIADVSATVKNIKVTLGHGDIVSIEMIFG